MAVKNLISKDYYGLKITSNKTEVGKEGGHKGVARNFFIPRQVIKIVREARANFSHAPFVDKPRPFSGVYCDRNNVESLLESRTVRKAVLSTLLTLSQRETSVLLS